MKPHDKVHLRGRQRVKTVREARLMSIHTRAGIKIHMLEARTLKAGIEKFYDDVLAPNGWCDPHVQGNTLTARYGGYKTMFHSRDLPPKL